MIETKKFLFFFLAFFIIASIVLIQPTYINRKSNMHTSQLKQIVSSDGKTKRISFVDDNGKITIAADTGYATKTITKTDDGELEEYLDDKGEQVSRYSGYYGIHRVFDEKNDVVFITYLDDKGNPVIISQGYASEKRIYNKDEQIIKVQYYDNNGNPIMSPYYGFGKLNEYDENGNICKITYLDANNNPMMTKQGYAIVTREYYLTDDENNARVEYEYYYDESNKPVQQSLGQYGIHKKYNEAGQTIEIIYLNEKGDPLITKKGYTKVVRTYNPDDTIATELYYGIRGEPFQLTEGQYGIKKGNGQTAYLDEDGAESFNLRNLLYNSSWIIIPFAVILIILSSLISQKLNVLLIIPYILVIAYLTLMFRENIGEKGISFLKNYGHFFTDSESRASIIKNIWLFIPLGAFLYRLTPRKSILFLAVILSVLIECIQFFNQTGFCELDDVISNTLGGCIGFNVAKLTKDIKQRIKLWKQIHIG